MDSRDIKEEPVSTKSKLEQIYSLQKELIDKYITIESLPKYPIDINAKKSQSIFKDFIGRVIEELSESFESIQTLYELLGPKEGNYSELSIEEKEKIFSELQNTTEEISDALHFFIELLIYAGINPEDVQEYLEKISKGTTLHEKIIQNPDILENTMIMGIQIIMNPYYPNHPGLRVTQLLDYPKPYNQYNILDKIELPHKKFSEKEKGLMQFGQWYTAFDYNISLKIYFWDITYYLNIARNCLKNKPWKQSQMLTDSRKFLNLLLHAFVLFLGTCSIMGLSSDNLYRNYFKKNRINKFRQESKY